MNLKDHRTDYGITFTIPTELLENPKYRSICLQLLGLSQGNNTLTVSTTHLHATVAIALKNASLPTASTMSSSEPIYGQLLSSMLCVVSSTDNSLSKSVNAAYDIFLTWYQDVRKSSTTSTTTATIELNSAEEQCLKNVFATSLLLTLTGWHAPDYRSSLVSGVCYGALNCTSCGRSVDLHAIQSSRETDILPCFHSLQQHRIYCPWTGPTKELSSVTTTSSRAGWQAMADALLSALSVVEEETCPSNSWIKNNKRNNSELGSNQVTALSGNSDELETVDPRAAYKRIKRVLDLATASGSSVVSNRLFHTIIVPK